MLTFKFIKKFRKPVRELNRINNSRSLLKAINLIVKEVIESDIESSSENCSEHIEVISRNFNTSESESLILAIIVAAGMEKSTILASDLANVAYCENIDLLPLLPDIDDLRRKGIINGSCRIDQLGNGSELDNLILSYSDQTRKKLFSGFYSSSKEDDETYYSIIKKVDKQIHQRYNDEVSTESLIDQIEYMFESEVTKSFNQSAKKLNLTIQEKALVLYLCQAKLMKEPDPSIEYFCERFFDDHRKYMDFYRSFMAGKNNLISAGYIQMENQNCVLTLKGIKEFLPDDLFLIDEDDTLENNLNLIMPQDIQSEKLFYPAEVKKELNKITNWARRENFFRYGKKLQKKGFYSGLSIKLSGPSGTGKTSFCYQLAKETDCPIFKVEVNDLISKYVGNSEKNTRRVFRTVRELTEKLKSPIIMLWNEGDSLIHKRNHNDPTSAGRSDNAVQSIILEELEVLESIILIMTTNAGDYAMDSAYARRFLFSLEMPRPGPEERFQIWKKYYPRYSKHDLSLLAKYDLSGSEIANIVKLATIQEIEDGGLLKVSELEEMIKAQNSKTTKNILGYR